MRLGWENIFFHWNSKNLLPLMEHKLWGQELGHWKCCSARFINEIIASIIWKFPKKCYKEMYSIYIPLVKYMMALFDFLELQIDACHMRLEMKHCKYYFPSLFLKAHNLPPQLFLFPYLFHFQLAQWIYFADTWNKKKHKIFLI